MSIRDRSKSARTAGTVLLCGGFRVPEILGQRLASSITIVERASEHGDEQAEAPAAEHVGRPMHVEVHARHANEKWQKRRDPDRGAARDESRQ
jgi:hypothetical protein